MHYNIKYIREKKIMDNKVISTRNILLLTIIIHVLNSFSLYRVLLLDKS
jgi:hypothetical protein